MADHELEVSTKLGLPEFHGLAARLEFKYRAAWGKRGKELVEAASANAGMSPLEFGARLEADESLRDLFIPALERVASVADPAYRDLLARLLGAASDTAKVDVADYAFRAIHKLESLQVRALMKAWTWTGDYGNDLEVAPQEAQHADYAELNAVRLMIDIGAGHHEGIFTAAMGGLVYAGFLEVIPPGPDTETDVTWYGASSLGESTVRLAFPQVQFHRPPHRDLPSPLTLAAQTLFRPFGGPTT